MKVTTNTPVPQEFAPFDAFMPMRGVFFRHLNDHPFESNDSGWHLCDILFVSESWVIVRNLESTNPEELVFEPSEVEFAHGLSLSELEGLQFQHMHEMFMNHSVREVFDAGWRLVKEEGDSGIPF